MSQLAVNSITDANAGNTATINGMTPTADSLQGFRNRIINGDMRIDQRNAGASVTIADDTSTYTLDRWRVYENTDGVISVTQDSTAPDTFNKSLKITVTTADASLAVSQTAFISQQVEGFNIADFAWGTSAAKSITVSFWVRSSVTGTFGGCARNDSTRSYPFSYTISAANTWEYKTVTITGDTTGTWTSSNGIGLRLYFSVGDGGNASGTAGAWSNTGYATATGQTNLLATLNATWYITGVQLEVGSIATPFERRPYGTELALCQRYCLRVGDGLTGIASGTSGIYLCPFFANPMRASPTSTLWDNSVKISDNYAADFTSSGSTIGESSLSAFGGRININGYGGALTTGRVYQAYGNTDGYVFILSAEL